MPIKDGARFYDLFSHNSLKSFATCRAQGLSQRCQELRRSGNATYKFPLFALCLAISHREVRAIRVMKRQGAHAGFRVHHEALGKLHADFFRLQ